MSAVRRGGDGYVQIAILVQPRFNTCCSLFLPPQCHEQDLTGTPKTHARSPCACAAADDDCHAVHLMLSVQQWVDEVD